MARADRVTPRIWAQDGWVRCKTPFNEGFVEELKKTINWKLRQWSKDERVWLVDPSCLDEIIQVAQKYFPDLRIEDGESGCKSTRSGPQDAENRPPPAQDDGTYQTVANLMRSASTESLKRVYRALAADFHPDRGGDGDTLRRLNVAWDRIQQERGSGCR